MLVRGVSNPKNTIYFLTAYILKYSKQNHWYTISDLYEEVYKKKEMSFFNFVYCLDFLYLTDILVRKKGENEYVYKIINYKK